MLCEYEKSALTEAAAAGELTAALRARLASCESCRAAFAEEQALFAAVDSGLRAAANAEIPPSLLPRLRVAVASKAAAAPNRNVASTWLVAAGAVAALAIFLARLPRTPSRPPFQTRRALFRGTNVDGRASNTGDHFAVELRLERSWVEGDVPVPVRGVSAVSPDSAGQRFAERIIRSFRTDFDLSLRNGQTVETTMVTDPLSGKVMRVEVTLSTLK